LCLVAVLASLCPWPYVTEASLLDNKNYVLSSATLEKRVEQVLPASEGIGEDGGGTGGRGRDGPNNVYAYKYMHKNKKSKKKYIWVAKI
jgi:hypothetical protein